MKTHLRLAGLVVLTANCLALSAAAQTARFGVLITRTGLDLKGNDILTDSFDSSDTNKSTNGQYDPVKYQGDKGDIACNGNLINVGNAKIYGHASTGPGGAVAIASSGGVGDHEWQRTHPGTIEPGWATDDAYFVFPNTDLPTNYTSYLRPSKSGNVVLAFTNYGVVTYTTNYYDNILDGGNYTVAGYLTGKTIVTAPNVTLVLPSGMNGGENITIAPGASLQLDVGGTSVSIYASNIFNYGGFAGSLMIWCAPSVTSLALSGNAGFIGVLIAPNARASITSSGSIFDFSGTLVANSVAINGRVHLHYDEALSLNLPIPPSITAQPQDQVVPLGQDASFYVSAAGNPPLSYQWFFRAASIVDTNFMSPITSISSSFTNLTITNVDGNYAGFYSVVVTNLYGSVTSSPAMLTVYTNFAGKLDSVVCSAGQRLQFNVTGIPGCRYALEASTNLVDWVPLITNAVPFPFQEIGIANSPQRYYRSVYVP